MGHAKCRRCGRILGVSQAPSITCGSPSGRPYVCSLTWIVGCLESAFLFCDISVPVYSSTVLALVALLLVDLVAMAFALGFGFGFALGFAFFLAFAFAAAFSSQSN